MKRTGRRTDDVHVAIVPEKVQRMVKYSGEPQKLLLAQDFELLGGLIARAFADHAGSGGHAGCLAAGRHVYSWVKRKDARCFDKN
jgi:hypothetical protein